MGSGACFVRLSHGNPERCVPMVQECNASVESWGWGMFPSVAEEVAVVEMPSLRCNECVQGRETRPSLRQNHC